MYLGRVFGLEVNLKHYDFITPKKNGSNLLKLQINDPFYCRRCP